ncbi:MAG: hypothetical protein HY047_20850 [Acidobacteria bacterium]|nr:hypothetical protein [Acidobacteriota bacterium]
MTQRQIAWIGVALFALPLIAHAFAGTASRYVSDDYCAGYIFKDYGYLDGQRWFYLNWGAVPATLLLMALTDPAGSALTPLLTTVALVAWVAALTWAVRRITEALGDRWELPASLLVAEVIVYATLQDSPNVVQSLYLRIPMFEYVLPLVALALYAGWIAARLKASPYEEDDRLVVARAFQASVIVSGVATFVAGSLGPTYVVLQTATLGLALILNRLPGPKGPGLHLFPRDEHAPLKRVLIAGLIGSIAAMALVALAPGNAARQTHYPAPPGLVNLVTWSFFSTVFMFARPLLPLLRGAITAIVPHVFASQPEWLAKALAMSSSLVTVVVLVVVGGLMGFTRGREGDGAWTLRVLIGAPVVAFVLVAACMAPSVYGTSAPPPPRALIEPQFVLVCALLCWSYAVGVRLRANGEALNRPALAAIALALCAVGTIPIAAARTTMSHAAEYRTWARQWDEVDGQLRAAAAHGIRHAQVHALDQIGGVPAIVEDPKDWVNNCAARYYGLETITGAVARP